MDEEVVWQDGDLYVIKSTALFGEGFNVYRAIDADGETRQLKKANPETGWFTTLVAAITFAESLKP